MKEKDIKKIVKNCYSKVAQKSCSCCGQQNEVDIARSIGYSNEEISIASDANLGLGCGNPVAISNIKEGDIVLDLGSGAGFDAFIASKKVGNTGKVVGIDFTDEMIKKSKELADKYNYQNVEFRKGDIDNLPFKNEYFDVIISNCVINLAPNKLKVFKEAYRVLKKDGRMYVSDIVLLSHLSEEQKNDDELIAGCVGGALLKEDYINIILNAGFNYKIIDEDKEISNRQYQGINLESLKVELFK
ncbi:MAG: arsenite S-adenosylmethyltransferase [Thermoplasmatales archaeon SG8-52-3]|nr:MAG: arsenite S-adenosylmethyltransferase [Thermoplasmatales archaeon SG8-52-3]